MIRGVHTMFYSSEPEALRAFLRDKLGLPYTDVGEGWLIFDVPEADMGCHPADPEQGAPSGTHNISFYCDDIDKTVGELKNRGVEFSAPVADHGYGFVTFFKLPGGFDVQLYQPKYEKRSAAKTPAKKSTAKKRVAKAKSSKPASKKKSAATATGKPRRRTR